jgi:hypothetical protein
VRAQEDDISEIFEACDACCSDRPGRTLTGVLCTRHRQERRRIISRGVRAAQELQAVENGVLDELVTTSRLTIPQADEIRAALRASAMFLETTTAPMSPGQAIIYKNLLVKMVEALLALCREGVSS